MATLSVTNTFVAGTKAKASEVNANFTDIISWGNGNIQEDNLGTMNGTVTWDNDANELSISVTSSGTEGAVKILQDDALASSTKHVLWVQNSYAETAGAMAYFYASDAGHTAPAVLISSAASSGNIVQVDNAAGTDYFRVTPTATVIENNLDVNGPGTHTFTGNVSTSGNLTVNGVGTSAFAGTLNAAVFATTAGDITCAGDLDINGTGTSTFAGSVDVIGTLTTGGLDITSLTIDSGPSFTKSTHASDIVVCNDKMQFGDSISAYFQKGNDHRIDMVDQSDDTSRPLMVSRATGTGSKPLEVIRGTFNGTAGGVTLLEGEGWNTGSFTRHGTGDYTLTFNSAFGDTPTVTASSAANNSNFCTVVSVSTTQVRIRQYQISGTPPNTAVAAVDFDFHVIVIGPRA